jgi:DNA-binding NarL/FixJ family response regulator
MGPADRLAALSERERDVMALIADGLTNEAIARRLGIAQKTVEKHVAHVFQKLDVKPEADVNRRVSAVVSWLRVDG